MDFRYLKAFLAAAEQGSFSKAADSLKIAQSALSRQVKLLEESIQGELLIRSSKHLILTTKGKRLFDTIKRFQVETENLLRDGGPSLLRIGIPHGLLESWFQPLLSHYFETNDHNFEITIEDLPELREGLDQGRYEIVFTPFEIDSELIASRPILYESFLLVSAFAIDPENLQEHRWIIYGPGDHLLQMTRRHPRRMLQVNSITAILNLVKQGIGIAVLPDHMLKNDEKLFRYRNPKLPDQVIFASHLRYRQIPEPIQSMLNALPKT